MHNWLIETAAYEQLQALAGRSFAPSSELLSEVQAREVTLRSGRSARILTRVGRASHIAVEGVLTPQPNILALLFGGGTAYSEIVAALEQADDDPATDEIVFDIASPGGTVASLFETIAAIQATTKPRRVVASAAHSAAYALAAAVGRIEATSRAASFGSVGIVASFKLTPDTVDVTSSNAPNKRPDVTTEAGKAVVRSYLDELHALFVDAIAAGRGTTIAQVNATFGQGGSMLADAAKSHGLIDTIKASPTVAGPIPRRRVGEDNEALMARLLTWVAAGGDDLPVKIQAARMGQAMDVLRSSEVSHGDDEQIPTRSWSGPRDLGDQLADAMGAPTLGEPRQSNSSTGDLGDQLAEAMLGKRDN